MTLITKVKGDIPARSYSTGSLLDLIAPLSNGSIRQITFISGETSLICNLITDIFAEAVMKDSPEFMECKIGTIPEFTNLVGNAFGSTTLLGTRDNLNGAIEDITASMEPLVERTGKPDDDEEEVDHMLRCLLSRAMIQALPVIASKRDVVILLGGTRDCTPSRLPEITNFISGITYNIVISNWILDQSHPLCAYPVTNGIDEEEHMVRAVHMVTARNKYGPSGCALRILFSKNEGLLHGLTAFHYLRTYGRVLTEDDGTCYLDVMPEIKLAHEEIRDACKSNPLFSSKLIEELEVEFKKRNHYAET